MRRGGRERGEEERRGREKGRQREKVGWKMDKEKREIYFFYTTLNQDIGNEFEMKE